MSLPTLAGVALIAVATLAGAWLAGRSSRPRGRTMAGRTLARTTLAALALAGAAVVLAAVVLADLMPDIWRDLRASGLPWWGVAAALAAGFGVADVLTRRGCACRGAPAGGTAVASALAVHRALEGAAVALTGSAAVIAALAVHAAAEGFAIAALLRGERRGKAAGLLVLACLSPAAGAVALGQLRLPDQAAPVLTSLVAGVLLRAAAGAWQLRQSGGEAARPTRSPATAAGVSSRTIPIN